jgi:putative flippase GtrA
MIERIINIKNNCEIKQLKYLLIGIINTVIGYLVSVFSYTLMSSEYGLVIAAIIANIISITFSFFTYKVFVFRGSDNILMEYLRCYIVYGFSAVISIVLLAIFIQYGFNIWVSQFLVSCATIIFSYISHNNYTFRIK